MQGLRPRTPAKGLFNPLQTLLKLSEMPKGISDNFG